mmetsp:Transcript_157922/g.506514  ORF Transcript_157922/g.506514 Transcript_157922/m.506514 type:complete len:244 (+) Transcript_157922:24-755(+)
MCGNSSHKWEDLTSHNWGDVRQSLPAVYTARVCMVAVPWMSAAAECNLVLWSECRELRRGAASEPKVHRHRGGQGANLVPPPVWYEERIAGTQLCDQDLRGPGEVRELLQVRRLQVHGRQVALRSRTTGCATVDIQARGSVRRQQQGPLCALDLRQAVVVRVPVARCDRPVRAQPDVGARRLPAQRRAPDFGRGDVEAQLRALLQELMLSEVPNRCRATPSGIAAASGECLAAGLELAPQEVA